LMAVLRILIPDCCVEDIDSLILDCCVGNTQFIQLWRNCFLMIRDPSC
jgi:hypothetical protein